VDLAPYVAALTSPAAAPASPASARDVLVRDVLVRALAEAADEIAGAEVKVEESSIAFTSSLGQIVAVPVVPAAVDAELPQVNLRMPESLRMHVEQIAAVEGISVNTWLVRAVTVAVNQQHGPPPAAHGAWSGKPDPASRSC
jgi:hypothetical protein